MCSEVSTPVVLLVVGGDQFTLAKVAHSTAHCDIPVVIVNGSGAIATMLADIYKVTGANKSESLYQTLFHNRHFYINFC